MGERRVAMRGTECLADVGGAPSAGSAGAAYVNALAETVIGLYRSEVIRHAAPWRGFDDVECGTVERVACCNTQCVLEPLDYLPPTEYE